MSGNRYAVLIGNNEFPKAEKELAHLRCPLNDVKGLSRVLASQRLGAFHAPVVLNNQNTQEILEAVSLALKQADKNDLVLIYYSGHGKLNSAGRLHLATNNTRLDILEPTSVPVTTLRDYIKEAPARKVILILDCCYSGQAGSDFFKSGGVDDQLTAVFGNQDSRGIYILSASSAVQVATEKEGDQYSLLTKYLLEGIEEGKADFDDDGEVSVDDLYKYAAASMPGSQSPTKTALNVQGGELILARTGREKGALRAEQIAETFYHRKTFRDRYVLSRLTLGGALTAGICLALIRAIMLTTVLNFEDIGGGMVLVAFMNAGLLGAATTFGLAGGNLLWKEQDKLNEHPRFTLTRFLKYRALLVILLGALGFTMMHTAITLILGRPKHVQPYLLAVGLVFIEGIILSISLANQPERGWRLGVRGWLWRIVVVGSGFALAQLPFSRRLVDGIGLTLTLGYERYHDQFLYSDRLPIQLSSPVLWASCDAALVGVVMSASLIIGIAKTADMLTRSLERIDPASNQLGGQRK